MKKNITTFPTSMLFYEFKEFLKDVFIDKNHKGRHPKIARICGSCAHWNGFGDRTGGCVHITCKRYIEYKDCIYHEDMEELDDLEYEKFQLEKCDNCEFYLGSRESCLSRTPHAISG